MTTEVHKPNPKLLEEIYATLNLGDMISVHFFDGDTIIGRFLGVDLWGNRGDCIDVHVPDGFYYQFYLDEIASFDLVERYEDSPTLIHRGAFVPERDAFGSERFSWVAIDDLPHRYFDIDEDEFCRLYDSGVIWEWNRRYGTYLDSFEIGIYEDDLETMLKEVVEAIGEGTISNALRAAVYEGTGVYFSF